MFYHVVMSVFYMHHFQLLCATFKIQGPVKKVRGQLHYTAYNSFIILPMVINLECFFMGQLAPKFFNLWAKSRGHCPRDRGNFELCDGYVEIQLYFVHFSFQLTNG